MNSPEKLQKLRWRQQVQAQLAVEQRQLALWGLMAIDVPVLSQMPEPSGIMPRQATGGSSNQAPEEDSEYDLQPSTSGGNPSFRPGI
ncbi:unnamed protein product [Sphagnum troendelagicum]